MYLEGSQVEVSQLNVFLSLKVDLILTNSEDPGEMQHYAAFHLGLHCLPKYPFRGFQYTNGSFLFRSMMQMVGANSSHPGEMQHYAALHLGLHCLTKYPFRGLKYTKGSFLFRSMMQMVGIN